MTNNARCFPQINQTEEPNAGQAPSNNYRNFTLTMAFQPNSAPCVSGIYFEGGHVNSSGQFVTPTTAKFRVVIRNVQSGQPTGSVIWSSDVLETTSPWNKWFVEIPTTVNTKLWAGQSIAFEFRCWNCSTGASWSSSANKFFRLDDVAIVGTTACSVPPIPANIGNLVWIDTNNDGVKDAGESGIDGVCVKLYRDDGDTVFEPGAGDPLLTQQVTSGGGLYNFQNLAPGAYFVQVCPSNFNTGAVLASYVATSNPVTADSDQNDKNHSINTGIRTIAGVASSVINVSIGDEPTDDGDGANGNLSIDFGFKSFTSLALGNLVWSDSNEN